MKFMVLGESLYFLWSLDKLYSLHEADICLIERNEILLVKVCELLILLRITRHGESDLCNICSIDREPKRGILCSLSGCLTYILSGNNRTTDAALTTRPTSSVTHSGVDHAFLENNGTLMLCKTETVTPIWLPNNLLTTMAWRITQDAAQSTQWFINLKCSSPTFWHKVNYWTDGHEIWRTNIHACPMAMSVCWLVHRFGSDWKNI